MDGEWVFWNARSRILVLKTLRHCHSDASVHEPALSSAGESGVPKKPLLASWGRNRTGGIGSAAVSRQPPNAAYARLRHRELDDTRGSASLDIVIPSPAFGRGTCAPELATDYLREGTRQTLVRNSFVPFVVKTSHETGNSRMSTLSSTIIT